MDAARTPPHFPLEQHVGEGIEADERGPDEDDAADSALGADDVSETESIRSIAYEYLEEHGRTYHKDGRWLVPNDEDEQYRMDLLHHAFKTLFDGRLLFFADKLESNIHRVLDVGTGTGIWAIEMADKHPAAEILGTDLSPIQSKWLPPNCEFIIDDAEEPWLSKSFDVVHLRCMEGAFRNWPEIYRQAYQHTSPGGLIEVVSQDLWTYRRDGAVPKTILDWTTEYNEVMAHRGYPTLIAERHQEWMREAGFADIEEREIPVPLGNWAKDPRLKRAGTFYLASVLSAIDTYSMKLFVDHLGRRPEEVTIMKGQLAQEFTNMEYYLYTKVVVVGGMKPKQDG